MAHKDHGLWKSYKPTKAREDAPLGAMFARRETDGQDWYEYVHPGTNFKPDTVKIAAIFRSGIGYVVGPAVYDATAIFPADHIVVELDGYKGSDPQADLGGKVYDNVAGTFSDPPPMPPPPPSATETKIMAALDAITARLAKLEKR